MKIIADANLQLFDEDLPESVQISRVEGRTISNADLEDADALLLRSVTRVDAGLLHQSPVQFVATATSGIDHLDLDYLNSQGINWCAAPGSNADAVADYCLAAIAYGVVNRHLPATGLSVGIVGAGNVGSRLASRLAGLGCDVKINDPPLQESGVGAVAGIPLCALDELSGCHVISLHVPYTRVGKYATEDLVDRDFLQAIPAGGLLLNTCRGEVIAPGALELPLATGKLGAVIDVWRDEPDISPQLAGIVSLATPHIAGYSAKAKRTGVLQVLAQLWRYSLEKGLLTEESLGERPNLPVGVRAEPASKLSTDITSGFTSPSDSTSVATLKFPSMPSVASKPQLISASTDIWQTLITVLPLEDISTQFRDSLRSATGRASFDKMRTMLQQRKEFAEYGLDASSLTPEQQNQYLAAGFQLLR